MLYLPVSQSAPVWTALPQPCSRAPGSAGVRPPWEASPHGRGHIHTGCAVVLALAARGRRWACAAQTARGPRGGGNVYTSLAAASDASSSSSATEADQKLLWNVLRECTDVVVLEKADKDTIGDLVETMQELQVPAGETVVHQGDRIDSMYVVADGEIVVQRQEGKTPASRGYQFGAVNLLGNTPQQNTVTAKSDCRLFRLDRQDFDAVILARQQEDDDDEDDDDDEEEICTPNSLREIFVVSDSTGESANVSVQAALRQFEYCFGTTCGSARSTIYRFVRSAQEARRIAEVAAARKALVVYTVMAPKVHEELSNACKELKVESCDLWAALLETLEKKFGAKRSGVSGRRQPVSDEYMTIVRAIEYTRKVDDGVLPNLWAEADIMLVGPSRAGKTPLAFYLAQRGFKVANYPLVPDEEPPPELFSMDQKKCVGLMIQPERLQGIRMQRMAQFNRSSTKYASLDAVTKEVRWIKTFYLRRGSSWPIIDTSNSGVAETASRIMEIFDRRKGDSLAAAYVSSLTD